MKIDNQVSYSNKLNHNHIFSFFFVSVFGIMYAYLPKLIFIYLLHKNFIVHADTRIIVIFCEINLQKSPKKFIKKKEINLA